MKWIMEIVTKPRKTPAHRGLALLGLALTCMLAGGCAHSRVNPADYPELPNSVQIMQTMQKANEYLMAKWPDPGAPVVTNRERTSNLWTRGTYYEGLMELYKIDPQPRYYQYAVDWGTAHDWGLRFGTESRHADPQCAGQTYIDLYRLDPQPERIAKIKASIDAMVNSDKSDDWHWIDAIQMAMPVFAKLGVVTGDQKYWDRMHDLYMFSKTQHGDNGLYSTTDHLWWRDADYDPPYTSPNGRMVYWSRGNGWVFAAMVRVLEEIPADWKHRAEYENMLKEMAAALLPLQRADGFWNASLADPDHYGGPETSGTAFFVYGMVWGVRNGLLDAGTYMPPAIKAWNAMVDEALRPDGSLGYMQGTGADPSAGQPVTYDSKPDFEDYGLGAFLLAGTELHKLAEGR